MNSGFRMALLFSGTAVGLEPKGRFDVPPWQWILECQIICGYTIVRSLHSIRNYVYTVYIYIDVYIYNHMCIYIHATYVYIIYIYIYMQHVHIYICHISYIYTYAIYIYIRYVSFPFLSRILNLLNTRF